MLRMKIFKHPLFFPIMVTAIYFAVNLVLVLNHELWRDETNPYLVAKAMDFGNMFEVMRGEGHPLLWYFILLPFAKLGLSVITTNIISLLVMSAAVFLMARYAPFSKKTVVVIMLSSVFLYFNPVISRNYCLVVLGVVLTAIMYKDRLKHPIRYALALALLCQSHFLALGLAGVLAIIFVVEYFRKFDKMGIWKLVGFLGVVGVSVLASLPIVFSAMNSNVAISGIGVNGQANWLTGINDSLFGWNALVFELMLLCAGAYLCVRYPKQFLIFVGSMGWFLFVLFFVYVTTMIPAQKATLIMLFLVFVFWTAYYEKPRRLGKTLKSVQKVEILELVTHFVRRFRRGGDRRVVKRVPMVALMVVPVVLTVPMTVAAAGVDLAGEYSYSERIADYINQNAPQDAVILVSGGRTSALAVGILPFLRGGREIYDVSRQSKMDFCVYTVHPGASRNDIEEDIAELDGRPLYSLSRGERGGGEEELVEGWSLLQVFESPNNAAMEPELGFYFIPEKPLD